MNHVIDAFARNQDILKAVIRKASSSSSATEEEDYWTRTAQPILSSVHQDGYYNGILATADMNKIRSARRHLASGKDEEEVIESVSSKTKMAALGHSWVNCINVRIMLSRTERPINVYDQQKGHGQKLLVRRAVSVLNPFAKAGEGWEPCVEYLIQECGFVSLKRCQIGNVEVTTLEDEERLWSSFDKDISTADLSSMMDVEEQSRTTATSAKAETEEEASAPSLETTYDEDEDLWPQSSDWDKWEVSSPAPKSHMLRAAVAVKGFACEEDEELWQHESDWERLARDPSW